MSKCSLCVAVCAGACMLIQAMPVQGAIVEKFPIDVDTYIDSRDPTYNNGVATTAKVLVNGTDKSLVRALFRLPDGIWSISEDQLVRAKVWFYVWKDQTADRTVRLHPLTRGFVEGTGDKTPSGDGATWETYDGTSGWTCTGGDYDPGLYVDAFESTNWFSWDITALWNNGDLRSFGAMLRMDDESDPGYANMPRAPLTSSDGPVNERPYVEVRYVDWLRADVNGDGLINLIDFAMLGSNWLRASAGADIDIAPLGGDGVVDVLDLDEIASHWLQTDDGGNE